MKFVNLGALAATALLAMAVSASAANMIDKCEVTGDKGSMKIDKPAQARQLTLETNLPAPVWYNGDTADSIKDGME